MRLDLPFGNVKYPETNMFSPNFKVLQQNKEDYKIDSKHVNIFQNIISNQKEKE